jgi:hypothetical protein
MIAVKRLLSITALAASAVLVLAAPAAASWRQQSTPAPSGTNPTWSLSAVSCTGVTTCMSVGNVNGSLLSETRRGNAWTIVNIPDPGGGHLPGIWCRSASFCKAVGWFDNGGTTQTLAEVWNGSNWSVQSTPNPAGVTSSQLNDVFCVSASRCEAVGQATVSGGNVQTLAEEWTGSNWTIKTTQDVGGAITSELSGVSCTAANSCTAVGESQTGSNFPALVEEWNGSNWTIQATSLGTFSPLEGVSCTAANACTATGGGLAARWNGSSWTRQMIARPGGSTGSADLSRVSCTSKTRCMAVGSFPKDAVETAIAEQWDGTSWKIVPTPITTANDSSGLFGVSCTFSTACTGVGFYHNPLGPDHALAEDWALRWQNEFLQPPNGAIASGLDSVSCPLVNFCMSVGGDEENGSVFSTFTETWNGRSWSQPGTVPNASDSSLNGVACNGKKACTAVGGTGAGGSAVNTLALHFDGTNWTVQATPNPAGGTRNFLVSVSCPSVTACIAVGFFINGSGHQVPFAEHWNGTNWVIKTTPFPSGSTTSQLNSVSCTSSASCTAAASDNVSTWAEQWNGTNWTMKTTPTPSGGRNPKLLGVSCMKANNCVAVGDFVNPSNKVVPLSEVWNGTTWTPKAAVIPAGSISEFSTVSCIQATSSIACNAGGSVTNNGVMQPLGETWNGSSWQRRPVDSTDPNVTRATFSSVSCSTTVTCVGVGFYDTSLGAENPLGELFS